MASRNYTETQELTLICSDEIKLFRDKRQCNAWIRMHEKRCKVCAEATTTQTEFTIDYKINSGADKIRNQKIYNETVKKLTETLFV